MRVAIKEAFAHRAVITLHLVQEGRLAMAKHSDAILDDLHLDPWLETFAADARPNIDLAARLSVRYSDTGR